MYLESENTKFIRLQPSKRGKAIFFFAFIKNYCLSVFYSLFYCLFFGGCPLASLGSGCVAARSFARPCGAKRLGLALRATAFHPSACGPLGLQNAEKRYSSLRSSCVNMSPPAHPFARFLSGIPRGGGLGHLGPNRRQSRLLAAG